jgi:hypothetical protein
MPRCAIRRFVMTTQEEIRQTITECVALQFCSCVLRLRACFPQTCSRHGTRGCTAVIAGVHRRVGQGWTAVIACVHRRNCGGAPACRACPDGGVRQVPTRNIPAEAGKVGLQTDCHRAAWHIQMMNLGGQLRHRHALAKTPPVHPVLCHHSDALFRARMPPGALRLDGVDFLQFGSTVAHSPFITPQMLADGIPPMLAVGMLMCMVCVSMLPCIAHNYRYLPPSLHTVLFISAGRQPANPTVVNTHKTNTVNLAPRRERGVGEG